MGHTFDPVCVELSAHATWPAEISIPLGPWQIRATSGYTSRANSVLTATNSVEANWPELIEQAEAFYRGRTLPTIFQISAATCPENLDAMLDARGYATEKASQVWSADPREVLDATAGRRSIGQTVLSFSPDDGWLRRAIDESTADARIRGQIFHRIAAPRTFATILRDGEPICRALSAVHAKIAWLYCMATEPSHQRLGVATQLIHALAAWAIENNAEAFYLQVMADNAAAIGLYAGAKFTRRYDYHYRVRR